MSPVAAHTVQDAIIVVIFFLEMCRGIQVSSYSY